MPIDVWGDLIDHMNCEGLTIEAKIKMIPKEFTMKCECMELKIVIEKVEEAQCRKIWILEKLYPMTALMRMGQRLTTSG